MYCYNKVYTEFTLEPMGTYLKNIWYRAAAIIEHLEEINQVIDLINEAPPISAFGLYDVGKGTLTAIFGQVLTYLIICIQFQMPPN